MIYIAIFLVLWVTGYFCILVHKFGPVSWSEPSELASFSESYYLFRRTGKQKYFVIWIVILGCVLMFAVPHFIESIPARVLWSLAGFSFVTVGGSAAFKDMRIINAMHYGFTTNGILLACIGLFVAMGLQHGGLVAPIAIIGMGIWMKYAKVANFILWIELWIIVVLIGGLLETNRLGL